MSKSSKKRRRGRYTRYKPYTNSDSYIKGTIIVRSAIYGGDGKTKAIVLSEPKMSISILGLVQTIQYVNNCLVHEERVVDLLEKFEVVKVPDMARILYDTDEI